jgi:insertion element IS1 protein InsB
LARRNDGVFRQLKALLKPFGITRYDTDSWSPYTHHLAAEEHQPGKRNTQQSEWKHLTVRPWLKRLVRKMIGFSRSIQMHDMGLGSFTHRYACSLSVSPYAV